MTPDLLRYIDHLQHQNADDLAFYPIAALTRQGHVLVATENDEACGYLWHGPLRAGRDVVIYQACIDYDLRRRHHGFELVRQLREAAAVAGCLGIRLKCASSSQANEFWLMAGFACYGVSPGGVRRARDLNLFRCDLQPNFGLILPVEPSNRPSDRSGYDVARRSGVEMASRFSRSHYGK